MAPPKTYRNISTNITGWITVNTRYAGTRIQTSRLRRVMVSVSLTAQPNLTSGPGSAGTPGAPARSATAVMTPSSPCPRCPCLAGRSGALVGALPAPRPRPRARSGPGTRRRATAAAVRARGSPRPRRPARAPPRSAPPTAAADPDADHGGFLVRVRLTVADPGHG